VTPGNWIEGSKNEARPHSLDVASFVNNAETVPVGAGCFETAGISVLAGLTFPNGNRPGGDLFAVVKETLADNFYHARMLSAITARMLSAGSWSLTASEWGSWE
jgi:hypothetical protein